MLWVMGIKIMQECGVRQLGKSTSIVGEFIILAGNEIMTRHVAVAALVKGLQSEQTSRCRG